MTITQHVFRGEADMTRITGLINTMSLTIRHVIDFPWRLSSPTMHEGQDAAFWEDATGQIVGFAAWQYYWVEFRDDDVERRQLVEAHGFLQDENDGYVLLEHSLVNLPPIPTLPIGFVLRALTGEQEAAAYTDVHRAAFESTSMTPEWRARTIHTPQYRPELDLVIVAPDSTLAGFCVGWLASERHVAQIEPIGVHPRFHKLGLGGVLLLEMLHRFKQHGAIMAMVETNLDRTAARRAYEAVGFQQAHITRCKGKWMHQPTANNQAKDVRGAKDHEI